MHILWQRQTISFTFCLFLLNGHLPRRGVSDLSRITARVVEFFDKGRHQIMYNNVNKNPFSWPPSHIAIMPVHSFKLAYIFHTSGDIRKNVGMYFILNSTFSSDPSNQDLKEIYNVLSALGSKSLRYIVDGQSLPIYVIGRNHVIVLSEKIYAALSEDSDAKHPSRTTTEYNFANSPAIKLEPNKLKDDIKRAIDDNYVLLYWSNSYLKYTQRKKSNISYIEINKEQVSIRGRWIYRSFYDSRSHELESVGQYYLTPLDISETLFSLINIEILRNHNENLYSGIMPQMRFNRLKVLPKTKFNSGTLTSVFQWYSSYTGKIMNSFVCIISVEKLLYGEKEIVDIIHLHIYFIGEVLRIHDYMKKLQEGRSFHNVIASLLKDEFVTNSDILHRGKHYMFFRVQDRELKQYVFT